MTLSQLNRLPLDDAHSALLECCGSTAWADKLVAHRPFQTEEELFRDAENMWWDLDQPAWLEAFSKHPQIGARQSISEWSSQEQAGMNQATSALTACMLNLNRDYLERFGWIFIVCATGKCGDEMRADLERRLSNPPSGEIRIAAAEQAKIMHIRLRKLLEI